jgi:cell wall-associated NlpC family hydrolase
MTLKIGLTYILLWMLFLTNASAQKPDSLLIDSSSVALDTVVLASIDTSLADSMVFFARTYLGKPYVYGSTSGKSFDCSGYTQHVFGKHKIDLPHSSGGQAQMCEKIKPQHAQKGDLVFFTGRNAGSKAVGHVAMVTDVDGKRIKMIHATVHGGVMEEWYNESAYFSKRFLFVGRLK